MSQTVLFVPDLHKRDVDFNSIKGYMSAVEMVQIDLLNYLYHIETEEKYFIQLGDWYDKGYRSTGRVYTDAYYDTEIAKAVNGNAYICLGNHFFLERDANPEMYLIQPSYLYQPRESVPMVEPTFRTVPSLRIGNVQISFFHFSKTDKNYINRVEPGVQFHIGVYHDDCVLPSDIRSMAGYFGTTSNDYLNNIYSNVDMAICGHVHTSIGLRNYSLNSGKTVPIIVPGALAITENKDIVKHKSVNCPVLTIEDDGSFDMKYVEFSTHMELLRFYKVAEKKVSTESLDIMGTGYGENLLPSAVSLRDFLTKKGYTEKNINRIMNIAPGNTDLVTLWREIRED
jgi:hypothetical protein